MLGTFLVAALLLVASAIIGSTLAVLARIDVPWAAAPAYGLAALLLLCSAAVQLPGGAVTAAVITLVVLITCIAVLRRQILTRGAALVFGVVSIAGFVIAAIPFVGRGRVGLLGMGLNNDTSVHLLWVEATRTGVTSALPHSYPLGPHRLVAMVGTVTGVPSDLVLQGLLTAVPVITALCGIALLRRLGIVRAMIGGLLAAFAYLPSAYYGQGDFKETLLGLFVIAFAAGLACADHDRRRLDLRTGALLALPPAAALSTFSAQGAIWFVVIGALFAVGRIVVSAAGGVPMRRAVVQPLAFLVPAVVVAFLLIVPDLSRIIQFGSSVGSGNAPGGIDPTNVGNLAPGVPVSFYAALGLWPSPDFRFPPADVFRNGQLAIMAIAATLYGAGWLVWRRQFALLAAFVGCLAVYLGAKHAGNSNYVTAKALAIMAPAAMLTAVGGLLAIPRRGFGRVVGVVVGVFVFFAVQSAVVVLRAGPVPPEWQARELGELRDQVRGSGTLYLGNDDFIAFWLRKSSVATVSPNAPGTVKVAPRDPKGWVYGHPVDWDTFDASVLDRFDYAIAFRTGYQSSPPSNWRLADRTAHYELYRRSGPTTSRAVIETSNTPGRVLDCEGNRADRQLSRREGEAAVRPAPVVVSGLPAIGPGVATPVTLDLPPGPWSLSLQYVGAEDLTISTDRQEVAVPAYLGRPGPFIRAGDIVSPGGPMTFWVRAHQVNRLASSIDITALTAIAASRPGGDRQVPLARACGKFVDWYRLAASSGTTG